MPTKTTCLTFSDVNVGGLYGGTKELTRSDFPAILGTNVPLTNPPKKGVKVYGFTIDLSVKANMAGANDCILLAVSRPDSLNKIFLDVPAGGVWSGGLGGGYGIYRSSQVAGWYSDDFGYWLTDYVYNSSFSASSYNSGPYIMSGDMLYPWTPTGNLEAVIRIMANPWNPVPFPVGRATAVLCDQNWEINRHAGGLEFVVSSNTYGYGGNRFTAPWSVFNAVDGEFMWVRVIFDENRVTSWYTGSPGAWTLVYQNPAPPPGYLPPGWTIGQNFFSFKYSMLNGFNASNLWGVGFNGAVSDFYCGPVGGPYAVELNLDDMSSSSDAFWQNSGTAQGFWRSGGTASGAFHGTQTYGFLFNEPLRFDEFRVYVEVYSGAVSIDNWCIIHQDRVPPLRYEQRGDFFDTSRVHNTGGNGPKSRQFSTRSSPIGSFW